MHESDQEAKAIWARDHGKVAYECDMKDNFWSMGGEKGLPCGPCTEIYYDHSDRLESATSSMPPTDDPDCIEIWNLVFMQYQHNGQARDSYRFNPEEWEALRGGNCVDTGMGLERLASVVQGTKNSNFEIDSLRTMIHHTRSTLSSVTERDIPYADFSHPDHQKAAIAESSVALRIIVDHMRSAS